MAASAGFEFLGAAHAGALVLTLAAPVLLAAIARRAGGRAAKLIRWALAGLLTGAWILWFAYLYQRGWLAVETALPMHLCDWATIVTIITLIRPHQRTYELAYFWALGGTLQALMTPDLGFDFPSVEFIVFFALHGGVIASVLYLTLGLRMRPVPRSLLRAALWSLAYMASALAVNALLDTNFGYLSAKPLRPSVLDYFAAWPYYIFEIVLLGGVSLLVYYAPFFIADRLRARRMDSAA